LPNLGILLLSLFIIKKMKVLLKILDFRKETFQ
jgi:hypothetical protein